MRPHRAVIAAGPGTIRRLCCDTAEIADIATAALEAIDDSVALVGDRPVAVESLWSAALRSLASSHEDGVIVVHPSWWSAARVGVVTRAAGELAKDVEVQPRSRLFTLNIAANAAVVEIAQRLVAVVGAEVVAVVRGADTAEEVARVIAAATPEVVLIDAPGGVAGAGVLAASIANVVRGSCGDVAQVDDARLARLARAVQPDRPAVASVPRPAARARILTLAPVAVVAVLALVGVGRQGTGPAPTAPTTYLVEGQVALTIPANWPTQRVVGGPGSARVQVTSPSDPEVALHVTQSPVPGETLTGTAQRLERAIDAEPAGVFVDFNPSGSSAGRPAVTYREVRGAHDVRWTVLLDGAVRISIGCQSRPGAQDAVRDVCEQAVRTAHALG